MSNEAQRPMPQYLSAPLQVVWFESDEVGLIIMAFTMAMIFGGFSWLLLPAVPFVYSRVKRSQPKGFLRHLLYYAGLMKMYGYPDFWEKEFSE